MLADWAMPASVPPFLRRSHVSRRTGPGAARSASRQTPSRSDRIAHHRRGAAIGHMNNIEAARRRLELLAAEMKDECVAKLFAALRERNYRNRPNSTVSGPIAN